MTDPNTVARRAVAFRHLWDRLASALGDWSFFSIPSARNGPSNETRVLIAALDAFSTALLLKEMMDDLDIINSKGRKKVYEHIEADIIRGFKEMALRSLSARCRMALVGRDYSRAIEEHSEGRISFTHVGQSEEPFE